MLFSRACNGNGSVRLNSVAHYMALEWSIDFQAPKAWGSATRIRIVQLFLFGFCYSKFWLKDVLTWIPSFQTQLSSNLTFTCDQRGAAVRLVITALNGKDKHEQTQSTGRRDDWYQVWMRRRRLRETTWIFALTSWIRLKRVNPLTVTFLTNHQTNLMQVQFGLLLLLVKNTVSFHCLSVLSAWFRVELEVRQTNTRVESLAVVLVVVIVVERSIEFQLFVCSLGFARFAYQFQAKGISGECFLVESRDFQLHCTVQSIVVGGIIKSKATLQTLWLSPLLVHLSARLQVAPKTKLEKSNGERAKQGRRSATSNTFLGLMCLIVTAFCFVFSLAIWLP